MHGRSVGVSFWQIVLQKSPGGLCEIEICNYRIGASVLLNRCCAFQPDLESIFLAEMLKILLQHNRHEHDPGGYPPVMKAGRISIGGWRSVAIYEYTPQQIIDLVWRLW